MENQESKAAPGSASFPLPAYLQDIMGVYLRLLKSQSDRAQGILERMARGQYKADHWVSDASQFWSRWFFDCLSVWDSFQRSATGDAVPTCVFILDDKAECGDPKAVPLAVRLQPGDRVAPTPFSRIDGDGQIGASRVLVKLNEMANRLSVYFRNIDDIDAGHYLGWVYAEKPGPKLPIAAIHLIKLEPEEPRGPARGGARRKKKTAKKSTGRKKK